jgi:hypothetical protein
LHQLLHLSSVSQLPPHLAIKITGNQITAK